MALAEDIFAGVLVPVKLTGREVLVWLI